LLAPTEIYHSNAPISFSGAKKLFLGAVFWQEIISAGNYSARIIWLAVAEFWILCDEQS
jgi:hypothetical protein